MRIINVLVLAACLLNIAYAKDSKKQEKDTFSHDQSKESSSIDSGSSNWVPLVLRRNVYDDDGAGINNGFDHPVMPNFQRGPPNEWFRNQLHNPVGKAYVRVEMEHPIFTGRTISSIRNAQTGIPSSGIITVTDNNNGYTNGLYGNQAYQGQGSITPLALGNDYGSSASGPVSSNNDNTGYNGNPTDNPSYASSAYTDHASIGQNGASSDYINPPSTSGTGYGSYENNYNYDVSSNYQSGPSSSNYQSEPSRSDYQSGAYVSTPGSYSGYTPSPAPSSGYVGYGGTFHNYGQQVSYPVAYRGRLPGPPHLVVVGAFGTPWAANQIEQEAGYYLYR